MTVPSEVVMPSPLRRTVPMPPDNRPVEAELITPTNTTEAVNRYELPDGTILNLRLVVTEIWRAVSPSEVDQQGNRRYVVKSNNIFSIIPGSSGGTVQ